MKWRRQTRKQQRGGGWGFNGPAFAPAGGMAPESARALTDDCAFPARPAPQVGGACGSCGPMFTQSGGACNCGGSPWGQRGGGSGTGGYGFDLTDNSMLKSYASLSQGSCPQKGGNRPDEIVAYPSGYDLGRAVALDSGARYLDPIPYGRSCSGGARRTRKGKRSGRKSRRSGRKGSRSAHRK